MLPAPAHVNQFSAGGRFRKGRYKGQPSIRWDCMVAVGVMALDAATGGAIRLSTSDFRERQADQDHNGIGLEDVAVAFRNTPGAPKFARGSSAWSTVAARLERGDAVAVTGTYSRLGAYRGSTYTGRHGLYLQRMSGGKVLVHDPIRSSPTQIPEAVVRSFVDGAGWASGTGGVGDAGGGIGVGDLLGTNPIEDTVATLFVNGVVLVVVLGLGWAGVHRLVGGTAHTVLVEAPGAVLRAPRRLLG